MKKSRFTEEQMVAILREADKAPVPEVARKHKVSAQAIYTWRRRFGELQPADVRRLRSLELENAKLKKLIADLEIDTMKEINRRKWITAEDLYQLKAWRESDPDAPDGFWYKDFGSLEICGEGKYPKIFLLAGQPAKGEKL